MCSPMAFCTKRHGDRRKTMNSVAIYITPDMEFVLWPEQDLIVTSFSVEPEGDGDSVDLGL